MVIEHQFVTTRSPQETMSQATAFLQAGGFQAPPSRHSFAVDASDWNNIELRRGKKSAARAKSIVDLPQVVRVEWDRGRVSVAASITPNRTWGGRAMKAVESRAEVPQRMAIQTDMLLAVISGVEQVVAGNVSVSSASQALRDVELQAKAAAKKHFWKQTVIVVVVLLVLIGAIALIVASN